jgi:hypothetical protein
VAEKPKPPPGKKPDAAAEEEVAPTGGGVPSKDIVLMPVSDVAEWDDDARLRSSPPTGWPYSGMSEEEAFEAAKKLPVPKGE